MIGEALQIYLGPLFIFVALYFFRLAWKWRQW
jgi:hypothetical protein